MYVHGESRREETVTTTSETMKRNWEDPKFREKTKKGRDRYWAQEMKRRFAELVKEGSD